MSWTARSGRQGSVYVFGAWKGTLARDLFPEACPLRVGRGLDEDWRRVASRIPRRSEWLLFHLDLTRTDRLPRGRADLCAALERRGVRVLNGRTTDISKRWLQGTCRSLGLPTVTAPADGDPDQLLIVKSNRNFGGIAEGGLSRRQRRALSLPPREDRCFGPDTYRVARRGEIDPARFADDQIVVERFVGNRDDLILRAYVVGDRLVLSEYRNAKPIKKMADAEHIRNHLLTLSDSPGAVGQGIAERAGRHLARFCAAAGFEFGALDLCVDDSGECYIIDANSTPFWGVGLRAPRWFEHLRPGLRAAWDGPVQLPPSPMNSARLRLAARRPTLESAS